MGLFKSEEETKAEKEAKDQKKFEQFCEYYHLDISLYDEKDMKSFKDISSNYRGELLRAFSNLLNKVDVEDLYYFLSPRLDTVIQQNFMILEELKKLNKK